VTASGHVTLVDCTLRDGGYYNDWDYSSDVIAHYVDSMVRAGVDVIEMGFRQIKADRYLGPTAWTTDEFLDQLNIPASITVAVMMNAKDVVSSPDARLTIQKMFTAKSKSRVDMIRFAAIHSEVEPLAPAVAELQQLGYRVALNLMQVSDRSMQEITTFGEQCKAMKVDVAYIADSFGGLRPHEIAPIMTALAKGFQGPVGCHLHDNMTYALSSTLAAVDAGATWVDSTVLGMGRGPGNVRTEYLAPELKRLGRSNIDVAPLVNLVSRDFTDLQRKHEWGSNLYYFLSANYGVHPTYVMELTKDGRYSPSQIVAALEHLNEHGGAQFDLKRLVGITAGRTANYTGSFDATDWCVGKQVLIIGPGEEARSKKDELELFIRQHSPIVIGLGAVSAVDATLIDAVAVCHPERASVEATALTQLKCPVFAPAKMLTELDIKVALPRDVGVVVDETSFHLGGSQVTVPRLLSAAYALAIAAQGGAKRIMLAGFDGFATDDHRFKEMDDVFQLFTQLKGSPQVVSITRTRYNVEKSSMSAPL
jgi:4-hydroxy 2-oxovalerate aldolase